MNGSCHCGRVAYSSEGRVLRFVNCHCDDCRTISGSPYSSALVVESSGFRIIRGESEITAYESSPGKFRCFCRHCGTPVYARMDYKPEVVIIWMIPEFFGPPRARRIHGAFCVGRTAADKSPAAARPP
jgi:hypothetical protein